MRYPLPNLQSLGLVSLYHYIICLQSPNEYVMEKEEFFLILTQSKKLSVHSRRFAFWKDIFTFLHASLILQVPGHKVESCNIQKGQGKLLEQAGLLL